MVLCSCAIEIFGTAHLKPYRRLQAQYKIDLLSGVPIEDITRESGNQALSEDDRRRLQNFSEVRWKQVQTPA